VPRVVTLLGIVILVKPVHPENAVAPMVVTELGMVMLVIITSFAKALSPILVTVDANV
jgi:hypothetical protein